MDFTRAEPRLLQTAILGVDFLLLRVCYNKLNRLKVQTSQKGATVLSSYTYELYPNGQRKKMTEHTGRILNYVYNRNQRLLIQTVDFHHMSICSNNSNIEMWKNMLADAIEAMEAFYNLFEKNKNMISSDNSFQVWGKLQYLNMMKVDILIE